MDLKILSKKLGIPEEELSIRLGLNLEQEEGIEIMSEDQLNEFDFKEKSEKVFFSEVGAPVIYRQKETFGCGSYCLANLMNDSKYILELQDGERRGDLNKKLSRYYPEIFLETLFLTNERIAPERLQDVNLFEFEYSEEAKESGFVPWLLVIYKPGSNLYHYIVACEDLKDRRFHVLDSTKNHISIFTREDLLGFYWVLGVEFFSKWDGSPEECVIFDKGYFGHIFK